MADKMEKRPVEEEADAEQTSKKLKVEDSTPTEEANAEPAADKEKSDDKGEGVKEESAEKEPEGEKSEEEKRKDMHKKLMEEESKFDSCFMSFPEKLMSLLNGEEVKECMWWLNDGDSFCLEPAGFAEKVLDKHFQGTKFESFTRKLNRWGFKRVAGQKVPPKAIAYYHHNFHKDKPELVKDMSGSRNRVVAGRDKQSGNDPRFRDIETFIAMKQHVDQTRATDVMLARQREALEYQRLRGMNGMANDPSMMFPYHMMMGHDMSGQFPMGMLPPAMGMPPNQGHPMPGPAPSGEQGHHGGMPEPSQAFPQQGGGHAGEPMDQQRMMQMYLMQQQQRGFPGAGAGKHRSP